MNLFRVSVKGINSWDKKLRNLYAVAEDKDAAIKYIEGQIRGGFTVHKVSFLGHALGTRLFSGGKNDTR